MLQFSFNKKILCAKIMFRINFWQAFLTCSAVDSSKLKRLSNMIFINVQNKSCIQDNTM